MQIVIAACAMSATVAEMDGRVARGERARTAICDALLDLIEEGELRPTAPRIAERAGVSLRTVFQHFRDLEALFATASDRHMVRLRGLTRRIAPEGPFETRLREFVKQRVRVLEAISPVRRAALLVEPFSKEVHLRLTMARARGKKEIEIVFGPELEKLPSIERRQRVAALTAASSWSVWENLRRHQQLPRLQAAKVVEQILRVLIER